MSRISSFTDTTGFMSPHNAAVAGGAGAGCGAEHEDKRQRTASVTHKRKGFVDTTLNIELSTNGTTSAFWYPNELLRLFQTAASIVRSCRQSERILTDTAHRPLESRYNPCALSHDMSLATGSRVGPYDILAPLASGGMGEVYRARDPRLQRDVAIK